MRNRKSLAPTEERLVVVGGVVDGADGRDLDQDSEDAHGCKGHAAESMDGEESWIEPVLRMLLWQRSLNVGPGRLELARDC